MGAGTGLQGWVASAADLWPVFQSVTGISPAPAPCAEAHGTAAGVGGCCSVPMIPAWARRGRQGCNGGVAALFPHLVCEMIGSFPHFPFMTLIGLICLFGSFCGLLISSDLASSW